MAKFRLRAVPWVIGGTGHTTITGSLQVRATKSLGSVLLGGSGRTVIGGGFSYNTPPPVGDTWTVPNQTFLQGSNQTYDLKPTVPASYTSGGLFDTDATGTPTPTGMTLSDDGILGVGTATETSVSNVKLGYTEQNALPVLTLIPQKTGVFPWRATAYPTKGAVPSGRFLVSPDDTRMRSSTISTWPDGSARVVVVASSGLQVDAGVSKQVRLRLNKATDSAGTDLTVARISQLISNVTINFGSPIQITNFASPDWVWWKNSQIICARYRVSLGMGAMEVLIDIHAFANHPTGGDYAIVECLIENGSINAGAASITTPATQTYSGTISVNGTQMASHTTPAPGLEIEQYYIRRGSNTRAQVQPTNGPHVVINKYGYTDPTDAINAGTSATVGVAIASGGTGAFSGQAGKIGFWNGSWSFVGGSIGTVGAPSSWIGDVRKEDKIIWTGSRWELGMAGGHESGRAWWSSAWIRTSGTPAVTAEYDPAAPGTANPGIEVTHSAAALQAHPLFFKQAVSPSAGLPNKTTNYGASYTYRAPFDKYVPYYMGRWRTNTMNDGSDDEHIGLYAENQADYILTGNNLIQRTVIADGLAWSGFAEHWRDQTTHQPPLPSQIGTKQNWNGNWPYHWGPPAWAGSQHEDRPYTDSTHVPSMAIVQFLCRPSPYFIEQAQHFLAWWWQNTGNGQVISEMARSRGWGTRNLAYASFLTPDNLYTAAGAAISQASRKAEYAQALTNAATAVLRYKYVQTTPPNTLNFMYGYEVLANGTINESDSSSDQPGFDDSSWMNFIATQCFHMADSCELLTGSAAATFKEATDWMATMPVRRIIECEAAGNSAWRLNLHHEGVGTRDANGKLASTQSNWSTMINQFISGTPPVGNGPWLTGDAITSWTQPSSLSIAGSGYNYQDWFITALSCAVERDIANASSAWDVMVSRITSGGSYSAYIAGYSTYTRYNRMPRNK